MRSSPRYIRPPVPCRYIVRPYRQPRTMQISMFSIQQRHIGLRHRLQLCLLGNSSILPGGCNIPLLIKSNSSAPIVGYLRSQIRDIVCKLSSNSASFSRQSVPPQGQPLRERQAPRQLLPQSSRLQVGCLLRKLVRRQAQERWKGGVFLAC